MYTGKREYDWFASIARNRRVDVFIRRVSAFRCGIRMGIGMFLMPCVARIWHIL